MHDILIQLDRMTTLQQIILDGYIDPELLEELSDEQKAILFFKMRQEQVRKWKEEEAKLEAKESKKPKRPPKPGRRNVNFLQGKDGREWVWVMGEYKTDRSIESILEEEAQERALKQAELELEEVTKKEEEEIRRKIEEEEMKLEKEKAEKEAELKRKEEEAALYASLKEAKEAAKLLQEEKMKTEQEVNLRKDNMRQKYLVQRRKSIEKNENWKSRRSTELFAKWKAMRITIEKKALDDNKELQPIYMQGENKSRQAEKDKQRIAREAREEVRNPPSFTMTSQTVIAVNALGSVKEKPPLPPNENEGNSEKIRAAIKKIRPPRPQNKDAVIAWFNDEERIRGSGLDPNTNKPAEWFHGIIQRVDAENLLIGESTGSFLVRVSGRVWGYTISYRAVDRCKHFLVDTSDDGYQFFGTNQIKHATLADLVLFHVKNPITMAGHEKLIKPCGQIKSPPDYLDLFKNRRSESTSL